MSVHSHHFKRGSRNFSPAPSNPERQGLNHDILQPHLSYDRVSRDSNTTLAPSGHLIPITMSSSIRSKGDQSPISSPSSPSHTKSKQNSSQTHMVWVFGTMPKALSCLPHPIPLLNGTTMPGTVSLAPTILTPPQQKEYMSSDLDHLHKLSSMSHGQHPKSGHNNHNNYHTDHDNHYSHESPSLSSQNRRLSISTSTSSTPSQNSNKNDNKLHNNRVLKEGQAYINETDLSSSPTYVDPVYDPQLRPYFVRQNAIINDICLMCLGSLKSCLCSWHGCKRCYPSDELISSTNLLLQHLRVEKVNVLGSSRHIGKSYDTTQTSSSSSSSSQASSSNIQKTLSLRRLSTSSSSNSIHNNQNGTNNNNNTDISRSNIPPLINPINCYCTRVYVTPKGVLTPVLSTNTIDTSHNHHSNNHSLQQQQHMPTSPIYDTKIQARTSYFLPSPLTLVHTQPVLADCISVSVQSVSASSHGINLVTRSGHVLYWGNTIACYNDQNTKMPSYMGGNASSSSSSLLKNNYMSHYQYNKYNMFNNNHYQQQQQQQHHHHHMQSMHDTASLVQSHSGLFQHVTLDEPIKLVQASSTYQIAVAYSGKVYIWDISKDPTLSRQTGPDPTDRYGTMLHNHQNNTKGIDKTSRDTKKKTRHSSKPGKTGQNTDDNDDGDDSNMLYNPFDTESSNKKDKNTLSNNNNDDSLDYDEDDFDEDDEYNDNDNNQSSLPFHTTMSSADKKNIQNSYKLRATLRGLSKDVITYSKLNQLSSGINIDNTTHDASSSSSSAAGPTGVGSLLSASHLQPKIFPSLLSVVSNESVISVSLGRGYCCIVTQSGRVLSFGKPSMGRLPISLDSRHAYPVVHYTSPQYVSSLLDKHIIQVATGWNHTFYLTDTGDVYATGSGASGRLGTQLLFDMNVPVKIEFPVGPDALAVSPSTNSSSSSTSSSSSSKSKKEKQSKSSSRTTLSSSTTDNSTDSPNTGTGHTIKQCDTIPIIAISCGYSHSMALNGLGQVFVWGGNDLGQLGLGDTTNRLSPHLLDFSQSDQYFTSKHRQQRESQSTTTTANQPLITSISCGSYHSAAVSSDGVLYVWGSNRFQQLGLGLTAPLTCKHFIGSPYQCEFCHAEMQSGKGIIGNPTPSSTYQNATTSTLDRTANITARLSVEPSYNMLSSVSPDCILFPTPVSSLWGLDVKGVSCCGTYTVCFSTRQDDDTHFTDTTGTNSDSTISRTGADTQSAEFSPEVAQHIIENIASFNASHKNDYIVREVLTTPLALTSSHDTTIPLNPQNNAPQGKNSQNRNTNQSSSSPPPPGTNNDANLPGCIGLNMLDINSIVTNLNNESDIAQIEHANRVLTKSEIKKAAKIAAKEMAAAAKIAAKEKLEASKRDKLSSSVSSPNLLHGMSHISPSLNQASPAHQKPQSPSSHVRVPLLPPDSFTIQSITTTTISSTPRVDPTSTTTTAPHSTHGNFHGSNLRTGNIVPSSSVPHDNNMRSSSQPNTFTSSTLERSASPSAGGRRHPPSSSQANHHQYIPPSSPSGALNKPINSGTIDQYSNDLIILPTSQANNNVSRVNSPDQIYHSHTASGGVHAPRSNVSGTDLTHSYHQSSGSGGVISSLGRTTGGGNTSNERDGVHDVSNTIDNHYQTRQLCVTSTITSFIYPPCEAPLIKDAITTHRELVTVDLIKEETYLSMNDYTNDDTTKNNDDSNNNIFKYDTIEQLDEAEKHFTTILSEDDHSNSDSMSHHQSIHGDGTGSQRGGGHDVDAGYHEYNSHHNTGYNIRQNHLDNNHYAANDTASRGSRGSHGSRRSSFSGVSSYSRGSSVPRYNNNDKRQQQQQPFHDGNSTTGAGGSSRRFSAYHNGDALQNRQGSSAAVVGSDTTADVLFDSDRPSNDTATTTVGGDHGGGSGGADGHDDDPSSLQSECHTETVEAYPAPLENITTTTTLSSSYGLSHIRYNPTGSPFLSLFLSSINDPNDPEPYSNKVILFNDLHQSVIYPLILPPSVVHHPFQRPYSSYESPTIDDLYTPLQHMAGHKIPHNNMTSSNHPYTSLSDSLRRPSQGVSLSRLSTLQSRNKLYLRHPSRTSSTWSLQQRLNYIDMLETQYNIHIPPHLYNLTPSQMESLRFLVAHSYRPLYYNPNLAMTERVTSWHANIPIPIYLSPQTDSPLLRLLYYTLSPSAYRHLVLQNSLYNVHILHRLVLSHTRSIIINPALLTSYNNNTIVSSSSPQQSRLLSSDTIQQSPSQQQQQPSNSNSSDPSLFTSAFSALSVGGLGKVQMQKISRMYNDMIVKDAYEKALQQQERQRLAENDALESQKKTKEVRDKTTASLLLEDIWKARFISSLDLDTSQDIPYDTLAEINIYSTDYLPGHIPKKSKKDYDASSSSSSVTTTVSITPISPDYKTSNEISLPQSHQKQSSFGQHTYDYTPQQQQSHQDSSRVSSSPQHSIIDPSMYTLPTEPNTLRIGSTMITTSSSSSSLKHTSDDIFASQNTSEDHLISATSPSTAESVQSPSLHLLPSDGQPSSSSSPVQSPHGDDLIQAPPLDPISESWSLLSSPSQQQQQSSPSPAQHHLPKSQHYSALSTPLIIKNSSTDDDTAHHPLALLSNLMRGGQYQESSINQAFHSYGRISLYYHKNEIPKRYCDLLRIGQYLALWQGIPSPLRRIIWPIAIGNHDNVYASTEYLALRAKTNVYRSYYQKYLQSKENPDSSVSPSALSPIDNYDDYKTILTPYLIKTYNEIDVDLVRTFPHLAFYQDGSSLKESMSNVLCAYALYKPEIGYIQGLSFLVGILLLYLDEVSAFGCLTNILSTPYFYSVLHLDYITVDLRYMLFEYILNDCAPQVYSHLHKIGFMSGWNIFLQCEDKALSSNGGPPMAVSVTSQHTSSTASSPTTTTISQQPLPPCHPHDNTQYDVIYPQMTIYKHQHGIYDISMGKSLFWLDWVMTLFTKKFDLDTSSRIWDMVLFHGEQIVYLICCSILLLYKDKLLKCDSLHSIIPLFHRGISFTNDNDLSSLLSILKNIQWRRRYQSKLEYIVYKDYNIMKQLHDEYILEQNSSINNNNSNNNSIDGDDQYNDHDDDNNISNNNNNNRNILTQDNDDEFHNTRYIFTHDSNDISSQQPTITINNCEPELSTPSRSPSSPESHITTTSTNDDDSSENIITSSGDDQVLLNNNRIDNTTPNCEHTDNCDIVITINHTIPEETATPSQSHHDDDNNTTILHDHNMISTAKPTHDNNHIDTLDTSTIESYDTEDTFRPVPLVDAPSLLLDVNHVHGRPARIDNMTLHDDDDNNNNIILPNDNTLYIHDIILPANTSIDPKIYNSEPILDAGAIIVNGSIVDTISSVPSVYQASIQRPGSSSSASTTINTNPNYRPSSSTSVRCDSSDSIHYNHHNTMISDLQYNHANPHKYNYNNNNININNPNNYNYNNNTNNNIANYDTTTIANATTTLQVSRSSDQFGCEQHSSNSHEYE